VYAQLGGGSSSSQYAPETSGSIHNLRNKWDTLATDMLGSLDPKGGNLLSGNMFFAEYVYFGVSEEAGADYQMLPERAQIENRCRRAALEIMSVNPQFPLTRVDLAMIAENKSFMGHPSTEQFLKALFVKPVGYDLDWSNAVARVSPRFKLCVHVASQLSFITLFIFVYTNLDFPDVMETKLQEGSVWSSCSGWELFLWFWVGTLMAEELQQLFDDYDGKLMHYLTASGNKTDAIAFVLFLFAFLLRVSGGTMAYVVMTFFLMMNLLVWMVRLLDTLSVVQHVGVILIAIQRIMYQNILPFIAFASLFVVSFEFAAYTFTWILEREFKPGEFFNMVSDVMNDQLDYNSQLGVLWWDRPSASVQTSAIAFKTVFFLMTIVILMNVLIAMMTNTYQQVFKVATQEWRLRYGTKIKEYYQSPVLPSPLTMFESLINAAMADKIPHGNNTGVQRRKRRSLQEENNWGRHDIFPVSSLSYELHMAASRCVPDIDCRAALHPLSHSTTCCGLTTGEWRRND
jgi:hypothetical protein